MDECTISPGHIRACGLTTRPADGKDATGQVPTDGGGIRLPCVLVARKMTLKAGNLSVALMNERKTRSGKEDVHIGCENRTLARNVA